MEQIQQRTPNVAGGRVSQWTVRKNAEGPLDCMEELSDRTDPVAVIIEGCGLALRRCLRLSANSTGNLRIEGSIYSLGGAPFFHPLEIVLAGVTASGDCRADLATCLGVEQEWISGFLDGFGEEPESSTDSKYAQGYLAAEILHREFPNR